MNSVEDHTKTKDIDQQGKIWFQKESLHKKHLIKCFLCNLCSSLPIIVSTKNGGVLEWTSKLQPGLTTNFERSERN